MRSAHGDKTFGAADTALRAATGLLLVTAYMSIGTVKYAMWVQRHA